VCESKDDLSTVQTSLKLPVVVKPVDLTGGKGVEVCHSWEAVEKQFHEAAKLTREVQIIIEEYIDGENHGTSMLLKEGKVVFSFFDNEEYFKNKYLVSGTYSPSNLTDEQKEDVVMQVEHLAQYAKLCDGLFHCQFIIDASGSPCLIDPCRRAPGDLYIKFVSYSTGIDYPMAIVKGQLGLSMDEELAFPPAHRCIARECMMAEANGFIKRIVIDPDYEKHIIEKMQWLHPGDKIDNYMTYKAGIVFFEYPNREELRKRMKNLYDHMRIEILA
jgi:biotin carboxylase